MARRPTRARIVVAATLVAALVVPALADPTPAAAAPGAPWFEPGKVYIDLRPGGTNRNFADPHIVRHGSTYYAFATTTGGAYLPVMRSTDQRVWRARPAYDPGPAGNPQRDPFFNDALPQPASWAPDMPWNTHPRLRKEIWAPGVARIGGRWVLFYAIRVSTTRERFCLSVATASSPLGPFVDNSGGPFHCDSDPNGSIDPFPFVDPATGIPYLIWKSEGVPGSQPTRIWVRRLAPNGTSWATGSSRRELLRTSQGWEGNVIETPAMVRHRGRYFLFYSGNEWQSDRYAIGFATCSGPLGPCRKSAANPIRASRTAPRFGPGSPAPYVDAGGRLRLGYQFWDRPPFRYSGTSNSPWRKLRIETLPNDFFQPRRFPDVPIGHFADAAVSWAAGHGITDGVGNTGRFQPNGAVTRAQLAAFIWRMMGEPRGFSGSGFVDVPSGAYFEPAVRWMKARGITTGVDGTNRYQPHRAVTRGEVAAMLHRLVGRPAAGGSSGFVDVPGGAFFAPGVRWMVRHQITTGIGGTNRFAPRDPVTRAQIVTFLHRLAGRAAAWGSTPAPPTAWF